MKRRIIMSNVLLICVPIFLTILLWGFYVGSHQGMYMNLLGKSAQGNGSFNSMQYMLYLYENQLAGLDFKEEFSAEESDPDIYPPEQMRRIHELSEMGFHLNIADGSGIVYSNMDHYDKNLLIEHAGKDESAVESLICYGNHIVINNVVAQNGIEYRITAVYDPQRVKPGVLESLLPVYLVAPQFMVVFLIIVTASVILTAFLITRWLSRSVLKPLDILVSGTKEIAEGNLDAPLSYEQEDEFGTVIREFDNMRGKLKTAREERGHLEEIKRDFLVGVSHDLRSPMTSIRGYAEGLKDGIADSDEKRAHYYDAILTRTADMERLLTSLSGLLRIEYGSYRLKTEKVNIDEFLKHFIEDEAVFAEQNAVTFQYKNQDDRMEAELDIQEMRRVFINLLDNSVKYRTRDRSHLCIHVSKSFDEKNVVIGFKDDGPGVEKEKLSRIFDSFYRGDESRTMPETGSGLGLAVVKGIVEEHGGFVQAFNNNGLEILITLPVYQKKGSVG